MRYFFVIIFNILSLMLLEQGVAMGQVKFQKAVGGDFNDKVYSFIDSGNGYVIAGSTNSAGAGGDDVLIIETDYSFNILSSFTIGGWQDDFPRSIIQCSDGGYAIIGSTYSFGGGNEDVLFVKLSQSFNVMWARTYGGNDVDRGFCLLESNNSFILGGTSHSNTGAWIIKTDLSGNIIWSKTYGPSPSATRCFSVVKADNGNYVFTGPYQPVSGSFDYHFLEVDNSGSLVRSVAFNASGNDHTRDIVKVSGDGYYMMGHSTSFGDGSWDLMLLKTDLNGNFQWAKNFGSQYSISASQMILSNSNGLFLTGHFDPSAGISGDLVIINCNLQGDLKWAKAYGGAADESTLFGNHKTIYEKQDGEYLSMGQTNSFGSSGQDIYIIGFDSEGNSDCNFIPFDITLQDVVLSSIQVALPVYDYVPAVSQPSLVVGAILLNDTLLCPVLNPPTASFTVSDNSICAGDCIEYTDLSLGQPNFWEWSFEGGEPASSVLQNPADVCYPDPGCFDVKLTVSNVFGWDTLLLQDYICVYQHPIIDLGEDTALCPGDTYTIDAGYGYLSYHWQDSSIGQQFTANGQGTYYVDVMDSNGCSGADTLVLTEIDVPDIYLGEDTNICGSFDIILDAGAGFDQYTWQDGSNGNAFLANVPGVYWVEGEISNCYQSDTICIIESCPAAIIFPNCFTPNGDGYNDVFVPLYENIGSYHLYIFNRWGQLLYESTEIDNGWDGRYKGRMCPMGVYFFLAEFFDGNTIAFREIKGSVSLIR